MELSRANTQIELSKVEKEIFCKVIWKINLIISYPMTDVMIESMAANILRLRPQTTIEELSIVVDDFLTGKRNYTPNKGISNFFRELEKINNIPPFVYDYSNGLDLNEFNRLKAEHERKYN